MNKDEKNTEKSMIKEASVEELIEWQLKCAEYIKKQGIINTDGLMVIPLPPRVYKKELEWPDESVNSWRRS